MHELGHYLVEAEMTPEECAKYIENKKRAFQKAMYDMFLFLVRKHNLYWVTDNDETQLNLCQAPICEYYSTVKCPKKGCRDYECPLHDYDCFCDMLELCYHRVLIRREKDDKKFTEELFGNISSIHEAYEQSISDIMMIKALNITDPKDYMRIGMSYLENNWSGGSEKLPANITVRINSILMYMLYNNGDLRERHKLYKKWLETQHDNTRDSQQKNAYSCLLKNFEMDMVSVEPLYQFLKENIKIDESSEFKKLKCILSGIYDSIKSNTKESFDGFINFVEGNF